MLIPNPANEVNHGHDGGFAADLDALRALNRRPALGFLGAASGAAFLAACGGIVVAASASTGSAPTPSSTATATPTPTATSTGSGSCVAYARETNGPYPADGTNQSSGVTSNVLTATAFQRQDIRSSLLGSSNVATGVQTDLTLTVVDVNNACTPLAGYAIYLWHCDATGAYSLYDLPAESYLRGVQVTDANGQVTFRTIFPGCYAGRYPHIHFEAFTSLANATAGNYARLVSQFALPGAVSNEVYAQAGYGSSLSNFQRTSIASDNVFGDNSSSQQAAMTLEMTGSAAAGYTGRATIGIAS
jgi:protocatechuate 3,4-dioxygenase beta subunit